MPERPLECSECKRPIAVHYTEMVEGQVTHFQTCSDCPVLHRKIHGLKETATQEEPAQATQAGLCCGTCGTTLEAVQTGNPLGCAECYEVFADTISENLVQSGHLPRRMVDGKHVQYHVGRSPGESIEISPSLRLLALNEALDETLSREDYEQAAWLRDQIKAITEQQDGN